MISEIELRARGDLECPDYVTKLDKLDKDLFTWKKVAHSGDDNEGETGTKLFHFLSFAFFLEILLDFFAFLTRFRCRLFFILRFVLAVCGVLRKSNQ